MSNVGGSQQGLNYNAMNPKYNPDNTWQIGMEQRAVDLENEFSFPPLYTNNSRLTSSANTLIVYSRDDAVSRMLDHKNTALVDADKETIVRLHNQGIKASVYGSKTFEDISNDNSFVIDLNDPGNEFTLDVIFSFESSHITMTFLDGETVVEKFNIASRTQFASIDAFKEWAGIPL